MKELGKEVFHGVEVIFGEVVEAAFLWLIEFLLDGHDEARGDVLGVGGAEPVVAGFIAFLSDALGGGERGRWLWGCGFLVFLTQGGGEGVEFFFGGLYDAHLQVKLAEGFWGGDFFQESGILCAEVEGTGNVLQGLRLFCGEAAVDDLGGYGDVAAGDFSRKIQMATMVAICLPYPFLRSFEEFFPLAVGCVGFEGDEFEADEECHFGGGIGLGAGFLCERGGAGVEGVDVGDLVTGHWVSGDGSGEECG